MAEQKNGGNKKKLRIKTDNKFKDFFLNIWIWFKETAWIQVVLVVVLVFGVVISIPLIVRAATTEKPNSDVALEYYKGKRKNVTDVNNAAKDSSKNIKDGSSENVYTTIFYYSEDASNKALSINKAFSDQIFGGNNPLRNAERTFYTVDLTRDEKKDSNDYDITTDQKTAIALNLAKFYGKAIKNYTGNYHDFTGVNNLSWGSNDFSGKTEMPTDQPIVAVYKNTADFDLTTAMPVSVRYGFSSDSDVNVIKNEFFGILANQFDYNKDSDSFTGPRFLAYDPNNPNGDQTDWLLRYSK